MYAFNIYKFNFNSDYIIKFNLKFWLRVRYLFSFLLFFLFACSSLPDVSSIQLKSTAINLDQLEFSEFSDSLDFYHSLSVSQEVLKFQFQSCLSIGSIDKNGTYTRFKLFKKDPYIKDLHNELKYSIYPKIPQINEDLKMSFKYLNYYFPDIPIPSSIVYFNSLFHSNIFCGNKELGIGIDCYLGSNSACVKKLPSQEFYQWLKNSMRLEYLNRDVLSAWIISNYIPENNNSVVEQMIRWGKIIYVVERCIPDYKKNCLLRYPPEKFDWAEKNESSIWKYLVNEQLLFSNNERDMSFLMNEGPFTIGLPEKSPDRLGQYIGWKMVHDYMDEHENISLRELIKTPYNSILQTYKSED